MHNFYIWFSTGISHILNWEAYDHVLFLFALCSIYTLRQWRQMIVLITAFTFGHSLTLVLSVLRVFTMNTAVVEFLIAVTIIAACLYNLRFQNDLQTIKPLRTYWMAAVFGLIHGLGFASILREMLPDEHILLPLFAFNIGIEAGQLLVVIALLLLMQLVKGRFQLKHSTVNVFVSTTIAGITLIVAISRVVDIFHH